MAASFVVCCLFCLDISSLSEQTQLNKMRRNHAERMPLDGIGSDSGGSSSSSSQTIAWYCMENSKNTTPDENMRKKHFRSTASSQKIEPQHCILLVKAQSSSETGSSPIPTVFSLACRLSFSLFNWREKVEINHPAGFLTSSEIQS